MNYLFEILIAVIITIYYILNQRPKLRYLIYGYFFFLITLIFQIPFQLIQIYIKQFLPKDSTIPIIVISVIVMLITIISKYYSLKSFVNTSSTKDGVLFGIGWATFESIQYFSATFFSITFTYLAINFDYNILLSQQNQYVNFLFFFVFNLSITVLIIFSIVKNRKWHLIHAIAYSCLVFYVVTYLEGPVQMASEVAIFAYSLIVIFIRKN